jgi:small nuclear ribonucleoprotein (snRNP)-like protein
MYRSTLESEIKKMLGKDIRVKNSAGQEYVGKLIGIDLPSLTLILGDAKSKSGEVFYRIVVNGNSVAEICAEKGFLDIRKLVERLERVFPKMVTYNEQAGVILVMDKIRVDETGVIEGSGLAAERVKRVYEEFMKEEQATQS